MINKVREKLGGVVLSSAAAFLHFPLGTVTGGGNDLPTNLANHVLVFLEAIAWPLAFIGIIYSAFILLTSMGNPDAMTKVKKNITFIATGIGLIIFATVIFNVVARLFSTL